MVSMDHLLIRYKYGSIDRKTDIAGFFCKPDDWSVEKYANLGKFSVSRRLTDSARHRVTIIILVSY